MKLKFLFITLLITFMGVLGLPFRANAVSQSSILVNIAPENPAPNENVTITLNSYASNLDNVSISWSVDGKTVLSGIGKKSFSLNAPDVGKETNVVASISLPDGTIDKRIIIRPAIIVLLFQANDSYVPPFYRGKALPTPGSEIKVVAMPEIKSGSSMIDSQNMTYAWKKDYTNNADGSGYGKNSFLFTNDYLENSNNISVVATTIDQKNSSAASLDVGTTQPKIVFYKNDPTMGTLWEQALSDGHKIIVNEIMEADPYFISPGNILTPTLTWQWSINDNWINVSGFRKNLIPLKVQPGVSGTSKIKLDVNHSYKLYETASKEINVNF